MTKQYPILGSYNYGLLKQLVDEYGRESLCEELEISQSTLSTYLRKKSKATVGRTHIIPRIKEMAKTEEPKVAPLLMPLLNGAGNGEQLNRIEKKLDRILAALGLQ